MIKKFSLKRASGFTLIELMAVLGILAIIAIIATPAINNIMQKAEQDSKAASASMVEKAASVAYVDQNNLETKGYSTDWLVEQGYLDQDPSAPGALNGTARHMGDGMFSYANANMMLDSNTRHSNVNYPTARYTTNTPIVAGETYTYQIKGELGARHNWWLFYGGGTSMGMSYSKEKYDPEMGIFYGTFTATRNVSNISVYAYPNERDTATIEWVKLEKGDQRTGWVAAE